MARPENDFRTPILTQNLPDLALFQIALGSRMVRCRFCTARNSPCTGNQFRNRALGTKRNNFDAPAVWLEVFSTQPFAFDEGDVAVIERLARTVLMTMSRMAA